MLASSLGTEPLGKSLAGRRVAVSYETGGRAVTQYFLFLYSYCGWLVAEGKECRELILNIGIEV